MLEQKMGLTRMIHIATKALHPIKHGLEPLALRVILRQPTVQVYLLLNLIPQLFYIAIAGFHFVGLVNHFHGLIQILCAVECFCFSVVWLRVGWLNINGTITVTDALLIILQFQLGICPIGIVNMVRLLQSDLDSNCVALYGLVVILRHECLVSCVFYGLRIISVDLLLPLGHFIKLFLKFQNSFLKSSISFHTIYFCAGI